MSGEFIDSITLTREEAEDLVVVLRRAIDEGVAYGHTAPGEREYEMAELRRKALLAKIALPLARAQARVLRGLKKKCTSCGKRYDAAEWALLNYVGVQEDHYTGHRKGEVKRIELRNCTCGSTISVVLEKAE